MFFGMVAARQNKRAKKKGFSMADKLFCTGK
jgi:hypothetical protein